MKNNLIVRNKKVIYKGDAPLLNDAFDYVDNINGFLVAYTSKKLVIVNPQGDIIVSEEGTIMQVYDFGKYISLRKANRLMGVYRYDGTLVLPFEFYFIYIINSHSFNVEKIKDGQTETYTF